MRIESKENQTEDLTVEEAKTFECCKDLTDEQIKELLENIRIFTDIAYSAFAKKKEEREVQMELENGTGVQYDIAV